MSAFKKQRVTSYFLLQERHLLVDFDLKLSDKGLHEMTAVNLQLKAT